MKRIIYTILVSGIFLSSGNVFAESNVQNKVNPLSKIPVESQIQNSRILLNEETTEVTLRMDSARVENSTGVKMMLYFEYNEQGLCISQTNKNYMNNTWQPSSRELYSYNSQGLRSEKIDQFYDSANEKWYSAGKSVYTYNEQNREILMVSWGSMDAGVTFVESGKTETTYMKDGQTESISRYSYNGSEWLPYSRDDYKYTDEGLRIAYDNSNWGGSDWIVSVKQEYAYNENGMRVLEIETYLDGISFVNNYKYEWEYDSDNKPRIKNIYYGAGQAWDLDKKYEYSYDEKGLSTSELLYKKQGGDIVLSGKTEYLYNDYSLLESRVLYNYDNGEWVEKGNEELTYYEPISMPMAVQSISGIPYLKKVYGIEFIENLPATVPVGVPTKVITHILNMDYVGTAILFYSKLKGSTLSNAVNNHPNIYSLPGKIILENDAEKQLVVVYNMTGQVMYQGVDKEIRLNSGMYLVKTANHTEKVVVY